VTIYNAAGYTIIGIYALACTYFAPPQARPLDRVRDRRRLLRGVLVHRRAVFVLSHPHRIAHRALDYREWFVKTLTVVNNTFGVYINPVTWLNRHRFHHKLFDHPGDPNKLSSDGFWRTLYLCLFP
jgi:hypothetical protein